MRKILNALLRVIPIGLLKKISGLQFRSPRFRRIYVLLARAYGSADVTVQRGAAAGLKFNVGPARNAGYALGTYEPEVQMLYRELVRPGFVIYDVGANVGFLAILGANLTGPKGRVICFEPLPANADAIEHNARMNGFSNITVIRKALGDREDTTEFFISADVGWGKLADTAAPADCVGKLEVEQTRLSTVIDRYSLPMPDLIKVDIEGAETAMLSGAGDVFASIRPILLVELHGTNVAVDGFLRQIRYRSFVVGDQRSIIEAPWSAFVVAVPEENYDLCHSASVLTESATLTR